MSRNHRDDVLKPDAIFETTPTEAEAERTRRWRAVSPRRGRWSSDASFPECIYVPIEVAQRQVPRVMRVVWSQAAAAEV